MTTLYSHFEMHNNLETAVQNSLVSGVSFTSGRAASYDQPNKSEPPFLNIIRLLTIKALVLSLPALCLLLQYYSPFPSLLLSAAQCHVVIG